MLMNTHTKESTLMNLVTFGISRSRIRMKLYFVYSLIPVNEMSMNELIVKYKVATCRYI